MVCCNGFIIHHQQLTLGKSCEMLVWNCATSSAKRVYFLKIDWWNFILWIHQNTGHDRTVTFNSIMKCYLRVSLWRTREFIDSWLLTGPSEWGRHCGERLWCRQSSGPHLQALVPTATAASHPSPPPTETKGKKNCNQSENMNDIT